MTKARLPASGRFLKILCETTVENAIKLRKFDLFMDQKTQEGCGCPKFLAGKVFGQISTLLENYSLIFRQHKMLSLPRFGHFPARKMAAGKSAPPSGTLLDFHLRDRHSLLEFS